MIRCISQATTLPSPFDADLRRYAQVGCTAVEVWLTKLETYLADHSLEELERLVRGHAITLAAAGMQGGLLTSQGEARRESFALFRRRLELSASLKIPTLILIADFVNDITPADYDHAIRSLHEAAQLARGHGVRLALEFQGRAAFCNNLSTAAALVSDCAEPNVGLCFDVFHYYIGPSKFEDLGLVTRQNLFHVQLSDLAGVPRELATDSDRVLPGDGDFQLVPILDHFHGIRYEGYVSVELMNPQIWQLPAEQVADISMQALRRLLEQGGRVA